MSWIADQGWHESTTFSGGPWLSTAESVVAGLGSDVTVGLGAGEVRERRERCGDNALASRERATVLELLARQFLNTMIVILAAAAAVTYLVGERTDTVVIVVIVVLNAIVGFVQEHRAERAMDELGELTASSAVVVRDGTTAEVPAAELVPGDIVRLSPGDVVPADLRMVEVAGLRTIESALTGESEPVTKTVDPLDEDTGFVGDRTNMVFKGTAITDGRGTGVVVAIGLDTELGRISTLLATGRSDTPLQKRLAVLGRRLATVAILLCAIVFGSGVLRGEPTADMFITAVSLAVAAIPESLPAVVTVALALGARRMAHRRALVRRLPAVETLGAVSVICTDKTGTLTENRMTVERVWTRAGAYTVTGVGYEPSGSVTGAGATGDPELGRIAAISAACNDATLHPPRHDGTSWSMTGDPTEGALLALAGRIEVHPDSDPRGDRHAEVPFDAERRRMTTIHPTSSGYWVATKGALETILHRLREGEPVEEARQAADALAAEGYRVLALAERTVADLPTDDGDLDALETELRLAGIVGIWDPPRAEVAEAIETCRTAGVNTVMITGDHPRTARAIGARLGLLAEEDGSVMTGTELDEIDDDELTERVETIRIFARSTPEQKLRIVDAWRRRGAVVAMTGDGVNDAPALQRAEIGVAMGITGTDVSREAADMVLADDNFATIVAAVEEGRRIYDNLRRFVRYMLTSNTGEVLVVLLGPFLGLPVPLTAAQILWINLVTDGLPAVALGLEPAEPDAMRRKPRDADESIVARGLWQQSVSFGLLMAAIVLPLQVVAEHNELPWQTMGFTTLALLQFGNALAVRSEQRSALRLGLSSNPMLAVAVIGGAALQLAVVYVPVLQTAFDTEPLTALQLGAVGLLSTGVFVAIELDKAVRRRRVRKDATA